MAESLQEQIVRLETLSLIQQQFVSDVSHELRTPLTTVRMASEMIYDSRDTLEPDIARAAELLRNQVDRFDLMLSDLLEISRIDAGAALLELGPVDVNMLVETLTGEYAEIATRHNTQIRTCLPNETVVAELDSRRIARILRNLVANAIEHSENKPIEVTVVANESVLAISVRDYGQGNEPE
jgi:two-component system sensor histidine kinase MtrB